MTVKTSISLTDNQEAYARSLVENGQYPSLSAVLQRGLDMLRRDIERHEAELDALRTLIDRRRVELRCQREALGDGVYLDAASGADGPEEGDRPTYSHSSTQRNG